jgi:NTP pyrophosphatase (non-canonical NTP hydrolase)
MLNKIAQAIHQNNVDKGFYDGLTAETVNIGERLALIHSEISEALEAHRKGRRANNDVVLGESNEEFKKSFEENYKDTFEDEIADATIRIFDLCGLLDIDLDKFLLAKVRYNTLRPYKHGKNY